jgi:hypothetical protein
MNTLRFNRRQISGLFWDVMDEHSPPSFDLPHAEHFDRLRTSADYNTGSLNEWDMVDLITIASYFRPKVIAEVGTFIGRSTYALAVGAGDMAQIYTCDASNDIPLPDMPEKAAKVLRFPRTTSTEMFRILQSNENLAGKVDLFFIDGRLTEADLILINQLSHERTVLVLDDFEGIEKGVDNAMLLGNQNHLLIYPRTEGKTALLVPIQLLQLTAQ